MMAVNSTMALGGGDHMSSKHEGAVWYRSQLGIESKLPTTFFKVTTPAVVPSPMVSTVGNPGNTPSTDPSEATIPILAPLVMDVPEADTLEHVPDTEDEPLDDPDVEPEPPSARQGIDIESLTD